jgi:hypothetical protein
MASKQSKELTTLYASIAERMSKPDIDLATIRDVLENLHLAAAEPEAVVAGASESPQPYPLEAVVSFQVRETHLDALSFVTRSGERLCLHLPPCNIASVLVEIAWDLARVHLADGICQRRQQLNRSLQSSCR